MNTPPPPLALDSKLGESPLGTVTRLGELDVFRGVAAISVLFFHYTTRFGDLYGHSAELPWYASLGHYGVQLFFMISGFVIFMTLARTQRPMDFVVSRFSRLYPPYWASVLLTFCCVALFGLPNREVSLGAMLVNLSMFQGLFRIPHVDGVYWTLQIELVFYILMSLLWWRKWLRHYDRILVGWVGLSLLFGIAETFWGLRLSRALSNILILPYIPFFALGMVFYKLWAKEAKLRMAWLIISLSLLAATAAGKPPIFLILILFLLLFWLFVNGYMQWIMIGPLLFLGTISYPLYLVHGNIGFVLLRKLEDSGISPLPSIVLATSVTVALASIITYTVEKPALRAIRNRYRDTVRREK